MKHMVGRIRRAVVEALREVPELQCTVMERPLTDLEECPAIIVMNVGDSLDEALTMNDALESRSLELSLTYVTVDTEMETLPDRGEVQETIQDQLDSVRALVEVAIHDSHHSGALETLVTEHELSEVDVVQVGEETATALVRMQLLWTFDYLSRRGAPGEVVQ